MQMCSAITLQQHDAVLEANLVQMKMDWNKVIGARTVGLTGGNLVVPKVRGEWPVTQEVLKDERCTRASLRGGLFDLQVNPVSEGQEEKPASSKSTVHHHQLKSEPLRRQRSRMDSTWLLKEPNY